MSNQVEIDIGCNEDGKAAFMIAHGALSEKARQTLALFSSAVPALIDCGLVVSVHYNADTDSIEIDAKL